MVCGIYYICSWIHTDPVTTGYRVEGSSSNDETVCGVHIGRCIVHSWTSAVLIYTLVYSLYIYTFG